MGRAGVHLFDGCLGFSAFGFVSRVMRGEHAHCYQSALGLVQRCVGSSQCEDVKRLQGRGGI